MLMRTSKVMSAAVAHSLATTDGALTMPQLRALVMLDDRGPLNLSAVAAGLGVDASNASRTCDRLVTAGLLDRRADERDRRHVSLTLTDEGRKVVEALMAERRAILGRVLTRLTGTERAALSTGLTAFLDAAARGEQDGADLADGDGRLLRWLT